MQTAESFPLCKVRGADAGSRRRGDNNKSFHPFAPLEVTLAFSDQGPEYSKLFSHRSQDLHSRPGFNSFRGNYQMSRRSSTHSLGHRLDFRRSLVSGLPSPRRVRGRSAGSFPEQRLVIEPTSAVACNSSFALLRSFLRYVTSLTEPHYLQQLYHMRKRFRRHLQNKSIISFLVYIGDNHIPHFNY